jgi:hypothetical protein
LLSVGLLWAQDALRVVHPYSLLFLGLMALTFGAAFVALACGLWRTARGPRRGSALAWLLVGLLPALGWAGLGTYAAHCHRTRDHPNNLPFRLVKFAAAHVMELEARYLYPHRLETARLVMFYDDRVADPEGDAAAMDRHLARMEKLTGKSLRAKVYWVRGRLLGMGGFCNRGVACGSSQSPAADGTLDRHELAHAVLSQHETPDTDPPTLLSEGWAVSQEWLHDRPYLAQWALAARDGRPGNQCSQEWAGSRCCLRDLTQAQWYHHGSGPVYPVGGAFVDFLIGRFGAERFVELYFTCRPGTFEADCQRAFGTDLDTLERLCWQDVEQTARQPRGAGRR